MKTFNNWLVENHPEIIDEGIIDSLGKNKLLRNALVAGSLAAGSLGFASKTANAADANNQTVASQDQNHQDEDIIEKGGMVYIRGKVSPKDNSPKSMLDAIRVAETKIEMKAAKYFQSKGGRPGFAPGGYKEITSKSDVLSGKSDRIVWAWKIPN